MAFVSGFLIPLIKIVTIGGILGYILFVVVRAIHITWRKSIRYFIKYKISFKKKPIPEDKLKYVLNQIENGIGYYDTKKSLYLQMKPENEIFEILWIYDEVLNTMKGGNKK